VTRGLVVVTRGLVVVTRGLVVVTRGLVVVTGGLVLRDGAHGMDVAVTVEPGRSSAGSGPRSVAHTVLLPDVR
jgi:hypothetical protein